MDGVSKGVEDGGHLLGYVGSMGPDVGHGEDYLFSKSSRSSHPDARGAVAKVPAACHAVSASSAYHVTFAADDLSHSEIRDAGADLDQFANELVADHQGDRDGLAGPVVPIVDVEVGAANARLPYLDQYVVVSKNGFGHFFHPKSCGVFTFYQSLHALRFPDKATLSNSCDVIVVFGNLTFGQRVCCGDGG